MTHTDLEPRAQARALRLLGSPIPATLSLLGALMLSTALIGADSRWLAALGDQVLRQRGVPEGVPYATATSDEWRNVPVLAELLFHALYSAFGDLGLRLTHAAAGVLGLYAVARAAATRGASRGSTAVCCLLVVMGAATTYGVVRLQLLSLALFPILLLLLSRQSRHPDRQVWLLVPLFALWSNLHGAVLVGFAVAGAYLLLMRMQQEPLRAATVLLACTTALFVTPALHRTPEYYLGVATNASAQMHVGLWARLSLTEPLDVVFLLCALALAYLGRESRPSLWEAAALLGLVVMTGLAVRNGVWLLLFAAPLAARGFTVRRRAAASVLLPAMVMASAGLGWASLVREQPATGASTALLEAAVGVPHHCPLYAEGLRAEQVALAGGKVWIANPLDAFPRDEQRRYVSWLETGETRFIPPGVALVLVEGAGRRTSALEADATFERVLRDDTGVLFARRGSGC